MTKPLVLETVREAREWVLQQRYPATGKAATVGLVPTMGALHQGHFSLAERSVARCDATIATIFVNPTQFGPKEDFSRYPRTLDADLEGLRDAGVDAVFIPAAADIYPENFSTYVDPPQVAKRWEGEIRPGHFRGVTTIVLKLFQILPANFAFFGQKDFQQVVVIQSMVRDLNIDIQLVNCNTVRDEDGLALSSRNRYLSPEERQRALGLSGALNRARELVAAGERSGAAVEQQMREVLMSAGVDSIDYAAIACPYSLEPMETIDKVIVALVAARVGSTRLIDNQLLAPPDAGRSFH